MSERFSRAAHKRIVYIDYLKGLTILWVVWYHTAHPDFVEFSFRIPLFFFVSGIFFKPYQLKTFIIKKFNTLLVPFVLFYLIYYVYLIGIWTLSGRGFFDFDFLSIFSVFHCYKGTESFVVNPPLWFIFALINLQLLLYLFLRCNIQGKSLAILSVLISIGSLFYLYEVPTLFMWSRCLVYFVYYVFGYIFGKSIIAIIDGQRGTKASIYLGSTGLILFLMCWIVKMTTEANGLWSSIINYVEIMSLILFMIYFMKYVSPLPFLLFLNFYGKNSYIVLGMHEMILTTLLIVYQHINNEDPGVIQGLGLLTVTTLILWPTIKLFNKVLPQFVGKDDLWKQ